MKRIQVYFLLIIIGLWSCVTEIRDFEQIDNNSFLTVEASLSDQVGPYRVYVSYSSPSITINIENKPIKSAVVAFVDDKGKTEKLTEIADGIYQTSATFKGIVGNTYTLNIHLSNGKNYFSSPEKLIASPKIDKINYNFAVKTNYPLTDSRSVGYDVTLDFTDSSEPSQYYQWIWKHYERTVFCASCLRGYDYSLNRCSSSINFPNGQTEVELINYKCSENCFDITTNSTYNLLSDVLLNGQTIKNIPIVRIPFNNRSIYYLQLEQRAISEKMYRYFKSIKDVTASSGTLFDVPAQTQFSPNMYCKENSDERILGAFEVFGSQQQIIYIDRNIGSDSYSPVLVTYPGRQIFLPSPQMGPKAPCVEGKYRTTKEPKDFKE